LSDWKWEYGNWESLGLEDLGLIPLDSIGVPWAYNVQIHPNFDRLFWSIWEEGLQSSLLVRPWNWPPLGNRETIGCRKDGNRLDVMPSPKYHEEPKYELVMGNMRFVACYITGMHYVPALLLPEKEWLEDVDELWKKYHPSFEGNWYNHPDYLFEKQQSGTAYIKSGK